MFVRDNATAVHRAHASLVAKQADWVLAEPSHIYPALLSFVIEFPLRDKEVRPSSVHVRVSQFTGRASFVSLQ